MYSLKLSHAFKKLDYSNKTVQVCIKKRTVPTNPIETVECWTQFLLLEQNLSLTGY